jgi:prepilin-type N-terminal cleavage/methylation domain-containing protein
MKILCILPRPRAAGFTLIELLVVISIIAVLAAASVGGYSKIVEGVRKKEATIMGIAVANGVEQFYSDYNRLPKPTSSTAGEDSESSTDSAEGIIKVLIGKEGDTESVQNPRNVNYLEGMKQAKPAPKGMAATAGASDKWLNGLASEDENYSVVDAWGNYYKLKLDSDYSSDIENPNIDKVAEGVTVVMKRVIVWSPGKDHKEETWDDNVMSWGG